jgi:hypothetical protein
MELVADYLFQRYIGKQEPLPFPDYLLPRNRYKNDFWITQEGECFYPYQMDDRHLINTIRMIDQKDPVRRRKYDECYASKYILYGKAPWNKSGGKKKTGNSHMSIYFDLWKNVRLYMLLRRELHIRGLEEHV